jgi:hypothetical protein
MPALSMWGALAYEVKMYFAMRVTDANQATSLLLSGFIRNAIAESTVLHARILCDLFSCETKKTSKLYQDDVGFSDLLNNWETDEKYKNLKSLIAEMKTAYGDYQTKDSPCWQFNKMLAHLTKERGISHSYEEALKTVHPLIHKIVSALESLKSGFPDQIV